jgi:lipopolysaccharide export system protein LptA
MTIDNNRIYALAGGHRIMVMMVLCLFGLCLSIPAYAQKKGRAKDEKVYLDHADELRYDQFLKPGVQIVKGRVHFRYQDTQLFCDSAYFNQDQNTFQAFGHVHMKKSKGITMTCDWAEYNSQSELFRARRHVVLTQPGRSLHCDSLDYNSGTEYANFFGDGGGRLVSGKNSVTSLQGEYYIDQHEANFYENVVMKSPKYTINTEHLNYNTQTEEAHVIGPSVIKGTNGEVVHTEDGYYYSKTDRMELNGHSTITSKERDVEGDKIKYNTKTGESEGHGNVKIVDKLNNRVMTGDHLFYNEKRRVGRGEGNVVYVDRKNKNSLHADIVNYTDSAAIAYGHALVKEFSQKDTLYMHADTLRMKAFHLDTDSLYREVYCYYHVRAYRKDLQAVCNYLVFNSKDSCMTLRQDPILWNENRQLVGDSIRVFVNDSTIREAHVYGNAFSVEEVRDKKHFNQISSKLMHAYFEKGELRCNEAVGNVLTIYYPEDDKDSSIIGLNYLETDTMRMYMGERRKLKRIWTSKFTATLYPLTQLPPGRQFLPLYAWYEEIRPRSKDDLYRWVSKDEALKGKGGTN